MKGKVKRIISRLLSVAVILSSCLQPFTVYATESEAASYETEYPALDKVRDVLAEDEIVAAEDYEIVVGSDFDVEHDFSGLETNAEKVEIQFYEAKNEAGQNFDVNVSDSYRAIYFVKPVSGNPSYHISRNIIVKENLAALEEEAEDSSGQIVQSSDNEEEETESEDEEEMLLFAIDTSMARRSSSATLVRGRQISYPGDLSRYSTCFYTINGKIAYCLESAKNSPASDDYAYSVLESNSDLQKALYYGYGGPGDITDEYMPTFSEDMKYVFTHIAASYFYSGIDGFAGCTMNDLEECGVLGWIRDLANLDDPPSPYLNLTKTSLKSSYNSEKGRQETNVTELEGDYQNYITLNLPDDVTYQEEDGRNKQTGGSVKIHGGISFYFTAPLTVSGNWNSGTLKGKIRNMWKAIVVSTGNSTQDIGSYYEEEYGSSVSFSVEWMNMAKVKVVKVDSSTNAKLSGAVFGLYKDAACTDLIKTMPATDANGASEAEIVMTQTTIYLKEITAPAGYRYNSTAYRVNLTVNQTTTVTVPDVEQLGNLTIYKEGEVLTGASSNTNGTTFQYGSRRQKGAVYNVYAGADIKTPYGALVYRAGQLVAENLITGDNGSVTLKNLHLGVYRVTEVQAPKNFYNAGESKNVTISYAGQMAEAAFADTTFTNARQKANVSIVKKDKDTLNVLSGGIFGLYASENIKNADGTVVANRNTLIEKVTTDQNGSASFKTDLPIGFEYYIKEIQAPENYLRNTEDVYVFRFAYTHDKEAKVSFSHTFVNERVNAAITVYKKDLETRSSQAQGDAVLEHAVYGLYARKNIVHPDGKTGILYKAGEQVGTLTTDKEGRAKIENLYLGEYFIKELTPSVGYLVDRTEYDLVCSYEGDLVATVEQDCTSLEQVKKQPFQIIKIANNGETDAALLAGAGFSAYLVSSLKLKADGSYDFDSATPVVIGENGITEIFTDENGYACSIALPYGTYLVRETTTPHNYKAVKDFIVSITEHKPDTPQVWRVLLDDEFEAKLKIIKQDDETEKPVLAKNTEFKLYDMDRQQYVEQITTYPTVVKHTSYFTDEKGYLILPQNLKIGHYRIEEVQAPFGYTLSKNYCEVAIDSDTLYQVNSFSGDVIIEAIYENHPVKGELHVVKRGEVLKDFEKDFSYETENLEGAVFKVYAAEDIYTADFQKDENGNRMLEYASGDLVATLTTDEHGKAHCNDLPLGTYKVVEVTAPDGYVLNESEQTVTFAYVDQETSVIEQTVTFENDRQKVEISVVKKDVKTKTTLEGATFGLYAGKDILSHGETIVEAGTLLDEAVTKEDGKADFSLDLPLGEYYIRELEAPAGYVSSDEILKVIASYQGQDVKVVQIVSEFENEPTTVVLKKTDITTGVELTGATLTVLDEDGNVINTWKSVKGEGHIIERLVVGQTYTLHEELAPYGYLQAQDVKFTIEDTAEIQKVEMKDDVPTGYLLINKKGEFLEKVSLLDKIGGWITHLFEYVTGSLKDVTFEVYALEDIRAADGESDSYYKKDELVATIMTDNTGHAGLENLPLGKYYVKEKETVEGYVLDEEIREIDLTYRDQNTAVVVFSTDWQNDRQRAEVTIIKLEKDSDRVLEGAIFALCAKEDIVNADGEIIMEADTIIEEKATDKNGKLVFEADLPIGFSYYVKETVPAPGFATTNEVQEFAFTYGDARTKIISFEFAFENEPTVFAFIKLSLVDDTEVEGVKLQITDENGEIVDEWVSGKEPHIIKELVVGKSYVLTEIMPSDGYVTAESIEFTVEDTGEIQKIEMKDDITKVEISKKDIAGDELPGATLKILDQDGNVVESWVSEEIPHYIEKLPIGKYILHEEITPDGYVTAESIEFTVEDTGEIQKIEMMDDVTKVEISKKDIAGDELPGATLKILDQDGNVVESWVSEETPHYIEKLPVGKYMLHEEITPDGYVTAADVEFTVEDTGEIQKIEMTDDVTKVEISKKDIAGDELPGATLKILDQDGNVVESWVSEETPHYIEKLPVGKYTLHEEITPDGYVTAEDIEFTVEDTGEIQKVEMTDDVTKAEISKKDVAGNELPGATLKILDQDGNVVESWVSEETPHYIEKLPVGEYTLHEEIAPEGYLTAEDVRFEVKDTGEVQKVVMVDEKKPSFSTPGTPKTGDDRHRILWMLLAVSAICGLCGSALLYRGKRRKNK